MKITFENVCKLQFHSKLLAIWWFTIVYVLQILKKNITKVRFHLGKVGRKYLGSYLLVDKKLFKTFDVWLKLTCLESKQTISQVHSQCILWKQIEIVMVNN